MTGRSIFSLSLILVLLIGCSFRDGNPSRSNILRIRKGMSLSEAKKVLGPPVGHNKDRHIMEWGPAEKAGPWLTVHYDPMTGKITKTRVIETPGFAE